LRLRGRELAASEGHGFEDSFVLEIRFAVGALVFRSRFLRLAFLCGPMVADFIHFNAA
jgi:hypothetical protein